MKNQYFGDSNDYFKYDLLIFLADQLLEIERLSIIWMLTPNDNSGDGGKTDYRRGTGDRGLFGFLKKSLEDGTRDVVKLGEYFQKAGYRFTYCPYGETTPFVNQDRDAYFQGIQPELLKAAIVFIDPDNGLEVPSALPSTMHKYVRFEEVQALYRRMDEKSALVIYQHLPRIHRKMFLYGLAGKLHDELSCPIPISISDNQITFIIVAKTQKRREEIKELLDEYTRRHLAIYD
jgi:hypothetical protein